MSTTTSNSGAEYEFSDEQNSLIGDLARKMSLVGFVIMLFGGLQLVNGVMAFVSARNPEKIVTAAREAGVAEAQLQQLEKSLTAGGWFSPFTASAIAFGLTGLLMVLVGMWTQQAAAGFGGIVLTKGQDISRLMDALGALHKKYSVVYNLLWIAAITSLISLAFSLYHMWSAKGG